MQLYEKYVKNLIDMILEGMIDGKQGERLKTIVPLTNLNMVTQLSNMLVSLLDKEITEFGVMEAYFLQALYWSVGAGLLEDGRVKFDAQVKYLASLTLKDSDKEPAGPGRYTANIHKQNSQLDSWAVSFLLMFCWLFVETEGYCNNDQSFFLHHCAEWFYSRLCGGIWHWTSW